jgi:hypothetical protein
MRRILLTLFILLALALPTLSHSAEPVTGRPNWYEYSGGASMFPWRIIVPDGSLGSGAGGAAVFSPMMQEEYDQGTCTGAVSIDTLNGVRTKHKVTLGAACPISFVQPTGATVFVMVKVVQHTGAHYNASWSAKWPSGLVPVTTMTDAAVDFVYCYLDGTSAYCTGVGTQNFY